MKSLREIIPSFKKKEHSLFLGMTGGGKTTLAEQILAYFPFVVVLDTKGEINWKGYKKFKHKEKGFSNAFDKLTNSKETRLIYTPPASALRGDSNEIEEFFHWVYWRRNTAVFVDEAQGNGVTTASYIPPGYHDCIARGRQKGIMVFSATQRPSKIPQLILSESTNIYCFRLQLPADCKKVEEYANLDREQVSDLELFHFYYSKFGEVSGKLKLKI